MEDGIKHRDPRLFMLQCMGFLQFRMFPSTFVVLYPNVAEEEEEEKEEKEPPGGSEDLDQPFSHLHRC